MSTGPTASVGTPATTVPIASYGLVTDRFNKSNLYASESYALAFSAIEDIRDNLERVEYSTLTAWLINVITNGGTGLTESAQQDLWDLETERDAEALADAKWRKSMDWAAAGWALPDGVLEASLAAIDRDYLNKRLDKSRDIRVKVEEMEIANIHFAVQQYTSLVLGYDQISEKAMESIAGASAQLAAGALAAAHAQASVGFTSGYSVDNNISSNMSYTTAHNTSYDADAE